MVSAEEYIQKTALFEKMLDNAYKKKNGIFYTDILLSKLIIQFLHMDKSQSIFDPCCGTGSFLYSALSEGYPHVYGSDIDADAVALCCHLTGLSDTVAVLDTLDCDENIVMQQVCLNQKADFIVGNPPYGSLDKHWKNQEFKNSIRQTGNNLFIAALYRAFSLAKTNGIIAYIIPKNFLHVRSYSRIRKEILQKKTILSIIDIGAYFPSVRGEQIILIMQNCPKPESHMIQMMKMENEHFQEMTCIPQNSYTDEILLFKTTQEYILYQKLECHEKLSAICHGCIQRGKSQSETAVTGKDIRKFGFKSMPIPKHGTHLFIQNIYSAEAGIIASFAGEDTEASQTVTVLQQEDELMCKYLVGLFHSRLWNFYLLKFCYNGSKLTVHTDGKYLSRLPLILAEQQVFNEVVHLVKNIETTEYMSRLWFAYLEQLNDMVYHIYHLSLEERNYIDQEMMSFQSKRWFPYFSSEK